MGNIITLLGFGIIVGIVAYLLNPNKNQRGIKEVIFFGLAGTQIGGIVSNMVIYNFFSLQTVMIVMGSLFFFLLVSKRAIQNI